MALHLNRLWRQGVDKKNDIPWAYQDSDLDTDLAEILLMEEARGALLLTWINFNSLRPSDAYMRQWTNHHWFR